MLLTNGANKFHELTSQWLVIAEVLNPIYPRCGIGRDVPGNSGCTVTLQGTGLFPPEPNERKASLCCHRKVLHFTLFPRKRRWKRPATFQCCLCIPPSGRSGRSGKKQAGDTVTVSTQQRMLSLLPSGYCGGCQPKTPLQPSHSIAHRITSTRVHIMPHTVYKLAACYIRARTSSNWDDT